MLQPLERFKWCLKTVLFDGSFCHRLLYGTLGRFLSSGALQIPTLMLTLSWTWQQVSNGVELEGSDNTH